MKRILAAAIALAPFSTAFAGDDIKVTGWVDFYYQYDFNKPAVGADVAGRGYDLTQNNFSLANAVVRVSRGATAKNPYGFTFDFGTGRNFEVNAGLDNSQAAAVNRNANSPTKMFQQGFLTYAAADGTTWDFGKFNTWIGYESVYAVDNANYSISPLFNYSQPFWHVGMRMTKPVNDSTTVGLYVVNGWNISDDDNDSALAKFRARSSPPRSTGSVETRPVQTTESASPLPGRATSACSTSLEPIRSPTSTPSRSTLTGRLRSDLI